MVAANQEFLIKSGKPIQNMKQPDAAAGIRSRARCSARKGCRGQTVRARCGAAVAGLD